jgi:hypothetical protein
MGFYYAIQVNQLLSVQSSPQVGLPMQRPSMRMPSPNSKYPNAMMHHKPLNTWHFQRLRIPALGSIHKIVLTNNGSLIHHAVAAGCTGVLTGKIETKGEGCCGSIASFVSRRFFHPDLRTDGGAALTLGIRP